MSAVLQQEAQSFDTIAVLNTHSGKRMTKMWLANGEISAYDHAKYYKVNSVKVTSIEGLHRLLKKLELQHDTCMIRGRFIGSEAAQLIEPCEHPGYFRRDGNFFVDQPLHACCIDVDGYRPDCDPVNDPVVAINQYIADVLPASFQGVSYCWQLSSSAGHKKNAGILKAHIWFWLERPRTSAELSLWSKPFGKNIDAGLFQPVQAHYTSRPLFEQGVTDPVKVRSGIVTGWSSDEVPLVIDDKIVGAAMALVANTGKTLSDPREKPGVIGAFCRAFSIEDVLGRWLPDTFKVAGKIKPGEKVRLDYLKSDSGAKEGAFIMADHLHIVNTHGNDPQGGHAANAFDLVRIYVYGHLDAGADILDLATISGHPSHIAMIEMAKGLPEVNAERDEVVAEVVIDWVERIAGAVDYNVLERLVRDEIAVDKTLTAGARAALALTIKDRFKDLKAPFPINQIRDMLNPRKAAGESGPALRDAGAGDWCDPYVWSRTDDCYVNRFNQQATSVLSFNVTHGRDVKHIWMTEDGQQMQPHQVATNEVQIPVVDGRMYLPWAGAMFEHDGLTYLNKYKPSTVVPVMAVDWSDEQREAVQMFERHIMTLADNEKDGRHFINWLAHNVQYPGRKIRHSPILKGLQGDGKTTIGVVLAKVMGESNVGIVSPKVLQTNFNGWAEGTCVAVMEELKMVGHSKHDAANAMKENHTNETIVVHRKGKDAYNVPNTVNIMAFTNFTDSVPLDEGERRYFVMFSPFTNEKQLLAAGMTPAYFNKLYDLMTKHIGAVRGWFLGIDLSKFDRNGRAPDSIAKQAMITMSRNSEESEIKELIESGNYQGVCEEMVSTHHLSDALAAVAMLGGTGDLLKTSSMAVVLRNLGYVKRKLQMRLGGQQSSIWVKDVKVADNDIWLRRKFEETRNVIF